MTDEEFADSGNQETFDLLRANLREPIEEKMVSLLNALEYDLQNKMESPELVAYLCQPNCIKEIIRHAIENTRQVTRDYLSSKFNHDYC